MVKNPPSYAGNVDSIPGQGTKMPHDVGQLRPCATAGESLCHCSDPVQPTKNDGH